MLWIAFELVSSSYWKQRNYCTISGWGSCELLSNLYLRHIENNSPSCCIQQCYVVNCFRTCIFVILKTTRGVIQKQPLRLWIAFELVSSSYWKQHRFFNPPVAKRCELLSNLYLRHIENNLLMLHRRNFYVVNCFRTCIFVILKTTCLTLLLT